MTASQWHAVGVPPHRLRSLAKSGDLVRLRQGVYATRSAVQWAGTDATRLHVLLVLAVRAAIGERAVASHLSAAVLHRLDLLKPPPEGTVALTLPPDKPWNRAQPADVVFHSAELPAGHAGRLYGVPVTTVARTVADLARTVPFMDAVVLADSALHQEKTTRAELNVVLGACARWPGVRQARRVAEFADERAESPLESAARVVFAEFGLDPPELQATVFVPGAVFRVDFCWPAHRLVAEADGLLKYNGRADLVRQFERDRLLRDAGYRVVHFTWAELFQTPEAVAGRIRRAATAATPY